MLLVLNAVLFFCILPDNWIYIVMVKSTSQATIDDDECFDGEEEEQDQD